MIPGTVRFLVSSGRIIVMSSINRCPSYRNEFSHSPCHHVLFEDILFSSWTFQNVYEAETEFSLKIIKMMDHQKPHRWIETGEYRSKDFAIIIYWLINWFRTVTKRFSHADLDVLVQNDLVQGLPNDIEIDR